MYPKQIAFFLTTDIARRHEEEWQAMLRRPDAPPLPPEEPAIDVGARLAATIRGWMQRLPAEAIPPARIWSRDEEVGRPG
jgi:broad specificity phosphatase PhoE